MLADSPNAVDHDNVLDCIDCLKATYQPDAGQSRCFDCLKATSTKATTCEGFCSPGKYKDTNDASCVNCLIGKFASAPNAQECLSCPAGYFGLKKEWTLGIAAQTITENAGVIVTQGVVTGTLKIALQNEWT